MDFFFEGHWRLDLGLGNPNKSAVLLACLMVASLWLARRPSRASFAGFLIVFAALGVALIHTYSRGGLVAAVAGLTAAWLVTTRGRIKSRPRAAAFAALVLGLVVYANLDGVSATDRYLLSFEEDRSISNRLVLWNDAPRMMLDAPGGWGIGNSGYAWTQWYQAATTRYSYRSMVNSHLTWLVELGWIGRLFYLAMWAGLLVFCWPHDRSRPTAGIALGLWIAFGTGAVFSSVAEAPLLWVPPLVGLVVTLSERQQVQNWQTWRCSATVTGGSVLTILVTFCLLGFRSPTEPIEVQFRSGVVALQRGGAAEHQINIGVIAPDPRVLGGHFGRDIRDALLDHSTAQRWLISDAGEFYGESPDRLVFSGSSDAAHRATAGKKPAAWTYFNPESPIQLPTTGKANDGNANRVVLGRERRDAGARDLRRQATDESEFELVEVSGFQHYIPTWVEILTHPATVPHSPSP